MVGALATGIWAQAMMTMFEVEAMLTGSNLIREVTSSQPALEMVMSVSKPILHEQIGRVTLQIRVMVQGGGDEDPHRSGPRALETDPCSHVPGVAPHLAAGEFEGDIGGYGELLLDVDSDSPQIWQFHRASTIKVGVAPAMP